MVGGEISGIVLELEEYHFKFCPIAENVIVLGAIILSKVLEIGTAIPGTTFIEIFFETSSHEFLQETLKILLSVGVKETSGVVAPFDQRIFPLQPELSNEIWEPRQIVESVKGTIISNFGWKTASMLLEVAWLQELLEQSILALK